ncbi:hypothetical protein EYF80_031951 [Liparis tanakae]|uniref:Uncharacterized protein n=1 Tax=Liparis tanakae TaxID=230148 RepID=A0A4Z2GWP2_9TELE|nr:hypothetical protein EYF80_031951 [Liparis tanakae]
MNTAVVLRGASNNVKKRQENGTQPTHPGCTPLCRVCSRVLTRSRGWKSSVEQVPLTEPHTKALMAGSKKESSGTVALHSGLGSGVSLLGSLSSSLSMPVRVTVRRTGGDLAVHDVGRLRGVLQLPLQLPAVGVGPLSLFLSLLQLTLQLLHAGVQLVHLHIWTRVTLKEAQQRALPCFLGGRGLRPPWAPTAVGSAAALEKL